MSTIFLHFADRAEALSVLGATLGYASTAPEPGAPEAWPTGWCEGIRYDLAFLADHGVACGSAGDHVNLLWGGAPEALPDFGAHQLAPVTPSCLFAA